MDRVVAFGIGKLFQKNIEFLKKKSRIVAITDNSIQAEMRIEGVGEVIPVKAIRKIEFDYVVIFNKNHVSVIYRQLTEEYSIQPEKVIGWQDYLYFKGREQDYRSMGIIGRLGKLWVEWNSYKVCDFGLGLARAGIKGREYFADGSSSLFVNGSDFTLAGCRLKGQRVYDGYYSLYNKIVEEICRGEQFDFMFWLNAFFENSLEEVVGVAEKLIKCTRHLLIAIPYDSPNRFEGWNADKFEKLGEVREYVISGERCILISNHGIEGDELPQETKLFVVTHKEFVPLYDEDERQFRIPIQGGAALNCRLPYQGDDIGENISRLNPYINECTAMYWIWKNVRCKYVGIEHYRRVLLANGNVYNEALILSEKDIAGYMKQYDFLLTRISNRYPQKLREEIRDSIDNAVFDKYFHRVRSEIRRKTPDYLDAFDTVMEGYTFYPCNLFVTKWEYFSQYCEWLFSFIIDVIDEAELDTCDAYSKRVVGFIAERMLTVWLLKHKCRVKELFFCLKEK